MTRGHLHSQGPGVDVPGHRATEVNATPTDPDLVLSGLLHQQNSWLRWTVYICAVIGISLAVLMLFRPPPPSGNLQARPSSCGPYCR